MNRHAFPFRLLRLCLLLVAIGLVPQAHTQSLELEPVGTVRLPAGQQVLRCPICGGVFLSAAYQARFCSTACRFAHHKREQRKRKADEGKG